MNFKKLPANWKVVRLGRVAKVFGGASAPQDKKYFKNGKYFFVRVQDLANCGRTRNLVQTKDKVNDSALKDHSLVLAPKGSILFSKSGAAVFKNHRAILGKDAFIVSHLGAAYPKKELLDTDFLYFYLCQIDFGNLIGDKGYPSLRLSDVENLPIPLPPLPEQKRIVEILTLAEELINKQKTAIALIDKILMAKFLEMFGDPATNPKGWEVKRLGEILSQNQSGIWGDDPIKGKRNYPIIRSTEITHDGKIQIGEKLAFRYVSRNVAQNYILKKGDILVVKSSGSAHLIGRVALFNMESEFLFSNFIQRLHPNEGLVLPIYLYFILNSPYAYNYIRSSHTTTKGYEILEYQHTTN